VIKTKEYYFFTGTFLTMKETKRNEKEKESNGSVISRRTKPETKGFRIDRPLSKRARKPPIPATT
jgi:hypothetical protein